MVGPDLGSRLIKVNMTKVRKDETIPPGKPGIDFLFPDEKESLQKEQGGSSTDSKKKGSSIPIPKPASSRPLRFDGKSTPQPAASRSAENMFVEDMTSILKKHIGTVYIRGRSTFSRSLQGVPDSVNSVLV